MSQTADGVDEGAADSDVGTVGLASLLKGAVPFKEGMNVSDTYRGLILVDEKTSRAAIIKDLPAKELAAEIFGSAVAATAGLPVPDCFLTRVAPDALALSKGPSLPDGAKLAFASADTKQPSLRQLVHDNPATAKRIAEKLASWVKVGELYGFDSFSANVDRHRGNLLFDGDNEVWLIDHGRCFGGPPWNYQALSAAFEYRNRLRDWLTPELKDDQRQTAAAKAAELSGFFADVDIAALAAANHVADLLDKQDFQKAVEFLQQRLPHVPKLSATALNLVV